MASTTTFIDNSPPLSGSAKINCGQPPDKDTSNCEARTFEKPSDDETICITGMAGSFPSSRDVAEFEHNLWNKVDMVSDQNARWPHYHPDIPKRMGNIPEIDKFDAQYFGVHHKQANSLDPQGRLLLERAYEAITDAGINPRLLRGTRTGVFIGACFAETEKTMFYDNNIERGLGITGCLRSMVANRISFALGLQGPSMVVDTACSSSMYALDLAFTHIRNGQCEAAIVGGSNLLLLPGISIQFARIGALSQDGYCRPFDKNASGYVRSEAVVVVFLQQAKHSKRIYANLLYTKTNCDGHKVQGITYPSREVQQNLLTEFYSDLDIDTRTITYVEAHGTGTVVGDPEECAALDKVLCKDRNEPLLVGSVKSNMGHSEGASGVSSIAKILLAFEKGELPPNLYYTAIRPEICSIFQNRIKVCTEITPLPDGALVGINSFGFGGANAHALLKSNQKTKLNYGRPNDDVPRLLNWSGRTEESISTIFDYLRSVPLDSEYIGLLQGIQSVEEPDFIQRGFGVLTKGPSMQDPAICLSLEEQRYEGVKRPLIWMFSGMGSQWPEMGSSLMVIPLFKESIRRSHLILKPHKIDLIHIITTADNSIFDSIINSFVGIAAIQIALVDVLKALHIEPDYMIGHSVGELGCAYADGVMNQEQTIKSAYYRGLASVKVKLIRGSMAAVGIGYSKIKDMLPEDIDAACHNSAESSTISGPEKSVAAFITQLNSQNIFAKEVCTSNIAYHSRYVKEIGQLLEELTTDLCSPITRSDKWLSTSVPQSKWKEPDNRMSNSKYYVNNLLNSVLFEETCALLPLNAISIEIAPHGLLQAIVKRSMPTTIHIPLTQRGHLNNAAFFLAALGKLYLNGWTMPLEKLYPPITYPVSRGTAKISQLLRWDHSVSHFVSKFELNTKSESGERRFIINLSNEEFAYVAGHTIDGRCLFPATGYLELVWKTIAMMNGADQLLFNVEFEDVQFHQAITLQSDTEVVLTVVIQYCTGFFEISEGSTCNMTGFVREVDQHDDKLTELPLLENTAYPVLKKDNFYKEMRLRGYHYKDDFQSVVEVRSDGAEGRIRWNKNWVTFMDCMLQTMILSKDSRSLLLPIRIQRLHIFPQLHLKTYSENEKKKEHFNVYFNQELNIVQAGGIEFVGLVTTSVPRRKELNNIVLESYQFVPHIPSPVLSQREAYRICIQLMIENNPLESNFKVLEIDSNSGTEFVVAFFEDLFAEIPVVKAQLVLLTDQDVRFPNVNVENNPNNTHNNCHLLILDQTNLIVASSVLDSCQKRLVDQGFLILRRPLGSPSINWSSSSLNVIAEIPTETDNIILLRKRGAANHNNMVIEISNSMEFDWIDKVKATATTKSLLLVAQNNQFSGIIGLVNCIRCEPDIKSVSCVFIDDNDAPPFDPTNPLYGNQLSQNLAINVYKHGAWGSYRHLKLVREEELKPRLTHHYVNALQPGNLSSLTWLQGPLNRTQKQLVRIQYSAINFRDIMLATGRLPPETFQTDRVSAECVLGIEYSGITHQGQRVMGMAASGSLATLIQPFAPLTWTVPSKWSLQEAASVPVVYITVYSSFFIGKAISAGKSILIHAGSGGVGLAAIRVALAYNLEVFTTVSNPTKKNYILGLFPKLKECNIGNSRDCSFEQIIKVRTRGRGVDYVLNSLSGEKLQASVRCLGRGGVFLEIGKFDLSNDTKVGLGMFLKEISFRSVMVDNLVQHASEDTCIIHNLIDRDLQAGIIQPLKSTVFQVDETEKAYRFLSTGQHMGKVLIQVRRNEHDEYSVPINSLPRAYFDAAKVYIIPGGLGGFGLELADWLVLRGARKIVLSSSRGLSTHYQAYRIRIWKNYGCHTVISTADISTAAGCRVLINEAQQYGQIDGIFNLAVCLRDGLIENQTTQSFKDCAAPKSDATTHLDEITRRDCMNLKYFVVFSSISCGRGNAGQSNYGMTNSVMERIIEKRVSDGLSGKAIQWGAIGDVGLVAAMIKDNKEDKIAGTALQSIFSCINKLDILLTSSDPVVSSMVVAKKHMSADDAKTSSLIEMVFNIMGIKNTKSISMNTSLADLGVDSLMTIEIKQVLEREFDINMSSKNLRVMTFKELQTLSDADPETRLVGLTTTTDKEEEQLININTLLNCETDDRRDPIYQLKSDFTAPTFDDHLLIVPGVEGDTSLIWNWLSKQIIVPAFITNFKATSEKSNIAEMAQIYSQFYLEKVSRNNPFLVIGYSFGSLVALEIVRILEASGFRGHLLCIDGSPSFAKRVVLKGSKSNRLTIEQLQMKILNDFVTACLPTVQLDAFNERLDLLDDWQTKLQELINMLGSSDCNINERNVAQAATAFYNRSCATLFYAPTEKIKTDITLVRATDAAFNDIDEMYDLQSCTEGTVSLQYVDGNHSSVLESSSLSKIINQICS